MQYTPIQIEIIKRLGKKELTEGCIVKIGDDFIGKAIFFSEHYISFYKGKYSLIDKKYIQDIANSELFYEKLKEQDFEILGHIPHLEDIFRVAEEKGLSYTLFGGRIISHIRFHIDNDNDLRISYNPTLPLLEQDEKVLQELLSFQQIIDLI